MSTWEEEKVSGKKRASYSMIWFMDYIAIAGISIIIFYYYEVEIGLGIFYVGLAFAIFAVWNMINDPLIGFLTDKPMRWSKKYGLRMPWILFGGILTILFYFLLFTVPNIDAKNDPWSIFWYMVIVTCIYDTFYTILTTHAYGGFTNIFRTADDRRKGGTIGQWMGTISRFVMLGIVVPYIIISGDPSSYIRAAIITSIVMAIGLVLFIPGIHESESVKERYFKVHEYLEKGKLPYFKFLKIAFKQKNFKLGLLTFALFTIAYSLYYASTIYFVNEVIPPSEQEWGGMHILVGAAIAYTLAFCISIFIWSRFVADRIGAANLYGVGLIFLGLCFLASMWMTTGIEYVLWHLLGGIGIAAFSAIWMVISADTNDEVTNACGRHQEASLMGFRNFFFRFSFFVVAIVLGLTHILTGYAPGVAEQTEFAKLGIRINVGLIPALACFVGACVMFFLYDLKGDKREQLMKSLREKGL